MRESFKTLFAGAAVAASLAGATVVAGAAPAQAAGNGQHVEVCVRNGHWDISFFQVFGPNQDGNWSGTPVMWLSTNNTVWGRCTTNWEYWFKGDVYVNFYDINQRFLGQRKGPYPVPTWQGPDVFTEVFD